MFKSRTTLRLITLLFLLAGVLLLRKPVFGQTNLASPQIRGTSLGKNPMANIIESSTTSRTSN